MGKKTDDNRRRRRHAGSKAHERGVARAQVRAEDMHYSDDGLIGFGSTSESLACLGGGKRGEEEEYRRGEAHARQRVASRDGGMTHKQPNPEVSRDKQASAARRD